MKKFFALIVSGVSVLSPLAAPLSLAAEATPAPYVSYNFSYKGHVGTFAVSCLGLVLPTPAIGEDQPSPHVCDGVSVMNIDWNGKHASKNIDTTLPRNTATMQLSRPEDYGLIWYSPRVINGSLKRFLVIQNNTWDNLYGGVGGAQSHQTMIFDFNTLKFVDLVNPSGRKLYWNKAGTRAFFVPNSCGGGGCEAASQIMGLTLTSKQAVTLSKIRAAFSQDFVPNRTDTYNQGGEDKPVQTWKSARWINDRLIEAKYITVDGKTKTLRIAF